MIRGTKQADLEWEGVLKKHDLKALAARIATKKEQKIVRQAGPASATPGAR